MEIEKKKSSEVWYLLGGLLTGAAAGLLLAPKGGSEIRSDIADWGRRKRQDSKGWIASISNAIPPRVKLAAGIGAVKNGAIEAAEMSKEKAKKFLGS